MSKDDALDFSSRELCADGACIGTIGPDGRCKECGLPAGADPDDPDAREKAKAAPAAEPEESEEAPPDGDDAEQDPSDEAEEEDAESSDEESDYEEDDIEEEEQAEDSSDDDDPLDLNSRVLCSDGACIGVVGPDGRCRECGKPYGKEPDEDDQGDSEGQEDHDAGADEN